MRDKVVIGTRGSRLALVQSNYVANLLREASPGLSVGMKKIETRGDQIIDRPLAEIGGKGLFTEELERALHEKTIDIAVHSLKDLPVQDPGGLIVGAIPKRATPNDALVAREATSLATLKQGARVGTSSLRRKAQLYFKRPDLQIVDLRGNVDTRIAKVLERKELDAAVLACAGLERIGRADAITEVLKPDVMLPAPGQGALGIQCRADDVDVLMLLQKLDDAETHAAVTAERTVLEALGGGCQVPIGALALMHQGKFVLMASVASRIRNKLLFVHRAGEPEKAIELAQDVAKELMAQGADEIIAECR